MRSDLDVITLNLILVDEKEFLFLDDISKSVVLREDKTFSALANTTSMLDEGETFAIAPTIAIYFEDHDLTKSLQYLLYDAERNQEENVVAALVAIQDVSGDHDLSRVHLNQLGFGMQQKRITLGAPTLTRQN